MEILIIGSEVNAAESRLKFGAEHHISQTMDLGGAGDKLETCDAIFDFTTYKDPSLLPLYQRVSKAIIFFDTTSIGLRKLFNGSSEEGANTCFGFCGLPTFLNREVMEIALRDEKDRSALEAVCGKLMSKYLVVADQIGMVTPRVICMIINEAYYTLAEGTATRDDIDMAMKLGTNYPWGPFEWCNRIGLQNVIRVLTAVYKDTNDDRYQICPMLRNEGA